MKIIDEERREFLFLYSHNKSVYNDATMQAKINSFFVLRWILMGKKIKMLLGIPKNMFFNFTDSKFKEPGKSRNSVSA